MKRSIAFALGAALALAAAAPAAETIQANASRLGAGASHSGRLTVRLDRYSTDEERAEWRRIFSEGGQGALIAAWQEQNPRIGTVSFTGTMGYQIRAGLSVPTETGRRIFLATDRPISGFEMLGGTRRTEDYPIGWIELEVDAEGKGEGKLIGAAELVVENDRLVLKSLGTEPVRLTQVSVKAK
jgi:hypothetical protein